MSTAQYPMVTIPNWAQGRPGMGQGGYSAACFEAAVGKPLVINFRSPIPIETPMSIGETEEGWALRREDVLIMDAVPRDDRRVPFADTEPVGFELAAAGRANFSTEALEHEAPQCFSCGTRDGSMKVQSGLLPDGSGRSGSDWTPPDWTGDDHGRVVDAVVWTVMDCAQGFHIGRRPVDRRGVTVRYSVEVVADVRAGERYAVVAFDGHWEGGWDGRKRGAAANIFDAGGRVVARADSLWVAAA